MLLKLRVPVIGLTDQGRHTASSEQAQGDAKAPGITVGDSVGILPPLL